MSGPLSAEVTCFGLSIELTGREVWARRDGVHIQVRIEAEMVLIMAAAKESTGGAVSSRLTRKLRIVVWLCPIWLFERNVKAIFDPVFEA
jgi:hypothetical protein